MPELDKDKKYLILKNDEVVSMPSFDRGKPPVSIFEGKRLSSSFVESWVLKNARSGDVIELRELGEPIQRWTIDITREDIEDGGREAGETQETEVQA